MITRKHAIEFLRDKATETNDPFEYDHYETIIGLLLETHNEGEECALVAVVADLTRRNMILQCVLETSINMMEPGR